MTIVRSRAMHDSATSSVRIMMDFTIGEVKALVQVMEPIGNRVMQTTENGSVEAIRNE